MKWTDDTFLYCRKYEDDDDSDDEEAATRREVSKRAKNVFIKELLAISASLIHIVFL